MTIRKASRNGECNCTCSALEFAPLAAFGLEECVGCGGAPGSGGVVGEVLDGVLRPGFEDWGHEGPGGFDSVAVGEEGSVAEHGVEQETLVAVGGGLAEGFGVAEVHVDRADVHAGAGDLGAEAEGDALVGLDAHGEDVGLDAFAAFALLVLEEEQRRQLELDGDLGDALGEALAGADVEGNSGPAPVFDLEAEGGVGLGLGARVDAVFLAVADDGLAVDGAGAVLAADGVGGVDGGDGLPDLDLFGADGGGLEGDGRLHGDEAEELHDVVLDDVAEGSGGLVEGAAAFDADGFGGGDLDVVDVVAVPDVLEDAVGEAEDEDVLDGLFAEVVVDAEDLVFVEDLVDFVVEGAGGVEVVAEGLLDDDADPDSAAVGGGFASGLAMPCSPR